MLHNRRWFLTFGLLFGAWVGLIYALVSHYINVLMMPDIPLEPPGGSLGVYLAQYIIIGALLGVITALPDNRLAGAALGGTTAALLMAIVALRNAVTPEQLSMTLIAVVLLFLPLVIFMMPVAYLIRLGVDAQEQDPQRPHLWARRYLIPGLVTLVVVIFASFSLHGAEVRQAFRDTRALVETSRQLSSSADLPVQLDDTRGFLESSSGPYRMSWTDRIDTYFGPRPVGAELSQFMIVTRFDNGYAIACLYSSNRSVPTCTNHR